MTQKMLRHTLLSALIIGIFAGGYALALGGGVEFARNDGHSHDRWDG